MLAPTENRQIWTVSETNSAVRDLVENSLLPFWIKGEVGTLNIHSSGHVYLTLKDRNSQIRAVFFRGAQEAKKLNLRIGDKIEAFGRLTVYEVRGEYQFSIQRLSPIGLGSLQQRFEALKIKLEQEGLFAQSAKQAIPLLPKTIGVITSINGAAIRDFLRVIERRFPNMHIRIFPATVQGDIAQNEIVKGLSFFNTTRAADVIILTRGGGSMEDLWAFNEEKVARAIAASKIPVISAIGHEIDFTIADFVADLRAATPSAAAELVVGKRLEFEKIISQCDKVLLQHIKQKLELAKMRLNALSKSHGLQRPTLLLQQRQQYLDELSLRLKTATQQKIDSISKKYLILANKLAALNPNNVLKRGFAILRNKNGSIIKTAQQPTDTQLTATLQDGSIDLEVV